MQVEQAMYGVMNAPCMTIMSLNAVSTISSLVKTGILCDADNNGAEIDVEVCPGTTTTMSAPPDIPTTAWLFPLNVGRWKCESLFDLPDKLSAFGNDSRLRGFTVYKDLHFRAYIRKIKENSWYH